MILSVASIDWTQIILAVISLVGIVFGSTGFWAFAAEKKKKAREAEEAAVKQFKDLNSKVNIIVEDVQELKQAQLDTLEYRKNREERDKIRDAAISKDIELLKKSNAVMMENMLNDNYDRVKESKVYTLAQRDIYNTMFKVYKSLHYDGRMNRLWENIRTYPDEDGKIHPITDDEREEIAAL